MGPRAAAEKYLASHSDATRFKVTLYGSLAATGKGHLTDWAIEQVLGAERTEIVWLPEIVLPFHPNGMKFEVVDAEGGVHDAWVVYSVGGGALAEEGQDSLESPDVYDLDHLLDIMAWCEQRGRSYWEYVDHCEGPEIWDYLTEVWEIMKCTIRRGLENEGVLPGGLGLQRKANLYYNKSQSYNAAVSSKAKVYAYALATSEENASGSTIVTTPTCGSSGVLPAVLYHLYTSHDCSDRRILRALATAGLFGNVAKEHASISGADVGCQGEIGVACAMAAAAACQLFGGTINQIEYAAEMGLEHHLGLTCDPLCGLVQVPCIERNAIAAARALDACTYSALSDGKHKIDYDRIVEVMKETGHDLPSLYKETSTGGIAKIDINKRRGFRKILDTLHITNNKKKE
jgi:L-serine dehydratase